MEFGVRQWALKPAGYDQPFKFNMTIHSPSMPLRPIPDRLIDIQRAPPGWRVNRVKGQSDQAGRYEEPSSAAGRQDLLREHS